METATVVSETKPHWSQTPSGRRRLSLISKRAWKRRKTRPKSRTARRQIAKASARKHWSQTPKGKRLIAASNKRRSSSRTTPPTRTRSVSNVHGHGEVDEVTLSYALGHVQCWIQNFARSSAVSEEALTARLGQVLSSS